MDNEKEISFGAFDSELMHQEIFIPEGFEATIDGDKIILTRIENEDEKIRKALIEYFNEQCDMSDWNGVYGYQVVAWLEKQGQEPRKVSIWKHWKDGICGNGEGKLIYLIKNGDDYSLSSSLGFECDYIELSELDNLMFEKQGEHKLPIEKLPEEMKSIEESLGFTTQEECDEYNQMVSGLIMSDEEDYNNIDPHFGKLINKVEPKFKVGKWYIDNEDGTIFQIVKVLNNTYTYKTNEGKEYSCSHYSLENDAHLWTIQDAKGGDVLCYKDEISLYKHDIKNCTKQETTFGGFVYHCCYDGKRFITDSLYSLIEQDKMDIHPATKEQRDLLFKKMKEAGYTFDFEKKELKKVEKKSQRMISAEAKEAMYDKPTDEDMKEALRTEYEKGRADAFAQMQKEWSEEDEEMFEYTINLLNYNLGCRKWLQSLKERHIWKPSDAQIRALEYIINNAHNTSYSCKIAKELLEQLKKLKGE